MAMNKAGIDFRQGGHLGELEATAPHAKYLHYGTGVYGPKKEAITIKPKQKKALHWPGAKHPVKRVRQQGIKPHDFLRMAMEQKHIEDRMRPVVQNLLREAIMESIIRAAANSSSGASTSRARDASKQETNGFSNTSSSFGNVPEDFSYRPGSNFFTMSPGMIELEARRGKNPRKPVARRKSWRFMWGGGYKAIFAGGQERSIFVVPSCDAVLQSIGSGVMYDVGISLQFGVITANLSKAKGKYRTASGTYPYISLTFILDDKDEIIGFAAGPSIGLPWGASLSDGETKVKYLNSDTYEKLNYDPTFNMVL